MKELSIEEKAKRYDYALTKARNIVNSINVGLIGKDSFEAVFPELKESEDERVRKALINGFNKLDKSAVWYNGITIGKILAWLEKQDEKPQGKSALEASKEERVDNANKVEPKDYSSIDPHFFKPSWNEEDDVAVKDICDKLNRLSMTYVGNESMVCQEEIKWLKSLRPQKYYKWSEEDEQEFNFIIKFLSEKHLWSSIGWLRALKDVCLLQKQEFSEDDETYLNHIVTAVKNYYTDYEGKENPFREPLLDWLKSLRPQPQWKPSDEQIKALANALSLAKNCGEESAFDLRTLYEQIKKLKG